MKWIAALCAALSICCTICAQETKLEFEAASIKPVTGARNSSGCEGGPGSNDPTTFRCQNISLTFLLIYAFQVNYDQVQGPDWMKSQSFDVVARVAPGSTYDQFTVMLQHMLAARFGLSAHRETKEVTRFQLVVAKGGAKLKPAAQDSAAQNPPGAQEKEGYPALGKQGMAIADGRARFKDPHAEMNAVAGMLSGQLGRPVMNATNIEGAYDVDLVWVTEARAAQGDSGPTLMRAIQEQLGLKVESSKGPYEYLVVDHMEKQPTAN